MGFPGTRMHRLRTSAAMRRFVCETSLSVSNFVYPLFVCAGSGVKKPISSMDGCYHYSPDMLGPEIDELVKLGIPAILLFGLPGSKDEQGSSAWDANGPVQQTIMAIKRQAPSMIVITDVCLCEYTSHGHCGAVSANGAIDNDRTLGLLARMALSHAQAGADVVAPSDMMDGRVAAIRETLEANSFKNTAIMAYSAKYASCFYGPFRGAADSAPAFGDRRSYQMDPAASRQAMREIEMDINEGADFVMVKPAMSYLDIIAKARERFDVPLAAYHVSGEYMMLAAGAKAGVFDLSAATMETLNSIKRAGADIIITYSAKLAAQVLNGMQR